MEYTITRISDTEAKLHLFGSIYIIKSCGEVWTDKRGPFRKKATAIAPNGYEIIAFYGPNNARKSMGIHRLIAEAFVDNPYNLPQVNHIDYNRLNNSKENLEWCTHQQNQDHKWERYYKEKEEQYV